MCDMDVFCRTCMCHFPNVSNNIVESYNIFHIPDLADKLMQCSNIPVQASDEYPQLLCGKCFEKVNDFHEFQRMCSESLKTFKDILNIEQNVDCGNNACDMATSENPQCESELEGTLNIDDPIEFETDDFIIEYDDGDFETNCSTQIESQIAHAVDGGAEISYSDDIENEYDSPCMIQTSVETDNVQNNISAKSEDFIDENTLLGDHSASEEECVVDTLSEGDDESHLDSQEFVPKPDFNPASILKYPFHCVLCPKVFTYKHRLTAHMRRHQGLGAYPCNRKNCTRAYSRLCDLRQHLRGHDGIPREIYKCDVDNCGKEYTTKSAINIHMRKQHYFGLTPGTRKFICDICGAALSNARSLQDHHFLHVDKSQWPFGCDVKDCSARFRKISQLKEHKNRHAGIKPFVCPHCDKRFSTSSNLGVHVNYHTQEKKWTCEFCTRVFFTPANLRLHVQKEHDPDQTGARFQCRMCDKTLSTHTARKYHEMRHTGEKPYVCEECGRGFTQPSGLKTHKRIHLEMDSRKDFVCPICDRAFTSSVSLKHHEMKHTGEKPYECENCGIKFRYPTSLSRHRKQNLCKQLKSNKEEVDVLSVFDLNGQYNLELF